MFARWEAERRSADPRLAELDAEVHGATGCRLGELELHAAGGGRSGALDDVGPPRGADYGLEGRDPGGVAAPPDTAGPPGLVGEYGPAVAQRVRQLRLVLRAP